MTEQPTNATLEVKLDYLTRDIKEIKADVKEMKSDYVSRRELDAEVRSIKDAMAIPIKIIYTTAGTVLISVVYAILKLIRL